MDYDQDAGKDIKNGEKIRIIATQGYSIQPAGGTCIRISEINNEATLQERIYTPANYDNYDRLQIMIIGATLVEQTSLSTSRNYIVAEDYGYRADVRIRVSVFIASSLTGYTAYFQR